MIDLEILETLQHVEGPFKKRPYIRILHPVFAAELQITELAGPPPERVFDEKTGLYLWQAQPA